MGKRSRNDDGKTLEMRNGDGYVKKIILVDDKVVDATLALLFASSAGPVQAPPKSRYEQPRPPTRQIVEEESDEEAAEEAAEEEEFNGDDEELSSVDVDLEKVDVTDLLESEDELKEDLQLDEIMEASIKKPHRKRKRLAEEEDLEGKYMQKLAKEDRKEVDERQAERRIKRQRLAAAKDPDVSEGDKLDQDPSEASDEEAPSREDRSAGDTKIPPSDVPIHESLAPITDQIEIEKASRTVFLANVSTEAISSKSAKKTLLAYMASFFPDIPAPQQDKPAHKLESIRFRSTAYAGTALPKKAAFAKKELMDATTKSTNAYVVYSNAFAAREAVKRLNGTVVLDRHLRVDGVAHPAKTDHRRCVFVGNLGFVDDESMLDQGGENERKRSKIPSDVEEGLWRQFSKAGTVESVRVIRDEKTRVGKGFAYVQFQDANAVEAALLFNEKKYPPMLPRILRVVRAKAVKKTALASQASRPDSKTTKNPKKSKIYNPKLSSQVSSLQGRAGKLLGRAGAAQFKKGEGSGVNGTALGNRGQGQKAGMSTQIKGIAKSPENIVFEGYRASANSGKPRDLKLGGKGGGKKKGKPRTRSSKRASDWKKGGGKKAN